MEKEVLTIDERQRYEDEITRLKENVGYKTSYKGKDLK